MALVHDQLGHVLRTLDSPKPAASLPPNVDFHLFKWPAGSFELANVHGKVKKAHLLADKHASLKTKQEGDRVTVSLPASAPDKMDSVLVLETN